MSSIRAVAGEIFEFTVATSPSIPNATVELTALYGTDGVDVGLDEDSEDLVFPVTLSEGAPGIYSVSMQLPQVGPYWARVTVNGIESVVVIVRAVTGEYADDAAVDEAYTLAAVASTLPASLELRLRYSDGSSAGSDTSGTAITWPQNMTQVPGYADCWFFEDVVIAEGGRVQVTLMPPTGAHMNSVITVYQPVQTVAYTHFDGFEPDSAYSPNDWVSLSYLRRWAGWSSTVEDAELRELRATAIETFINETNCFASGWVGTWHGLRAQGTRLYLPMPIILPSQGGIEPEVWYTRREGDKAEVTQLSNDYLIWRVGGPNQKQPFIEYDSSWDYDLDIRIYATWGLARAGAIPLRAQQALVGLVRWHSLSYGVDSDSARDQATLNRITNESSRDVSHAYHELAIGRGVTGDRTIDRLLAEFAVRPGPWIRRGGILPSSSME
jgi:hypothetical protein